MAFSKFNLIIIPSLQASKNFILNNTIKKYNATNFYNWRNCN